MDCSTCKTPMHLFEGIDRHYCLKCNTWGDTPNNEIDEITTAAIVLFLCNGI